MAFTACILTTLLLLVSSVKASIDNTPTASAVCTPTGFSPTFGYAHEAGKTIGFEVHIGDVGVATGAPCNAELATVTGAATTIGVAQLNSGNEIPYLDSSQVAVCNGGFAHSGNYVQYLTSVDIVVTETIGDIKRQKRFPMTLKCKVERDVAAQTLDSNFQVPAAIGNAETALTAIDETFLFPIDFKFYTDSGRGTAQTGTFNAEQGSTLYLRLSENPSNSLLQFTTVRCYSTPDSSATHSTSDVFFQDECPADETVQFADKANADDNFDISLTAFFFTSDSTASIYVHCDIYICKQTDTSDACSQDTFSSCPAVTGRRKRRDVGTGGVVETRTLTSKQHVVLSDSEIIVPQCPVNSVYNRESKKCTKDNVIQVSGVYLDLPWNEDFANTSSKAFKDFALEKEYQLYGLLQLVDDADNILGVKVVGARQGSVILDVQIVYKSTIDSSEAFDTFKKAIQDPEPTGRASRIIHILNIKREKIIELVEIAPPPASSEIDKTMLVVLVVVLAAVVIIAGLVALKIRQVRRAPAATTGAPPQVKSFENPTLETVS
jgi:hypothetical protein